MSARQFDAFRASTLFCKTCQKAMKITERLLLVLPEKELHEYVCTGCQGVVGTREISAAEQVMRREAQQRPSGPQVRIF